MTTIITWIKLSYFLSGVFYKELVLLHYERSTISFSTTCTCVNNESDPLVQRYGQKVTIDSTFTTIINNHLCLYLSALLVTRINDGMGSLLVPPAL